MLLKLFKFRRVLSAINIAGMAGRSIDNVNRAYRGIRSSLGYGIEPYRNRLMNNRARYDVEVLMEGAEVTKKRYQSIFAVLEVLLAVNQVPGMQIVVSKAKTSKWGRKLPWSNEKDKVE